MSESGILCFWDYDKNEINPLVMRPKAKEKYYWKCNLGHEWIERLDKRKRKESVCKICEKVKTLDSPLISEWDYESKLNKNIDPTSLVCNARQRIGWVCFKGHKWEARLDHRISSNSGCPFCSGHKIIKEESSLAALFPYLLKEWDYEKNDVSPFAVASKTTSSYHWRCKEGHSWSGSVANRTRRGDSCPYCNKTRASEEYNLITEYPQIIELWDYEHNTKQPQEYLPFSNEEVVFKCSIGHKWKDKISAIVSGNRCEVCYPRKGYREVDEYYNLAYFSPELAIEYDENKNKKLSNEISPYSGKKVWWCCSKCHNEWQATVDNRQRGRNCPKCSEWVGTSFSEQAIFYYMRQAYKNVENRYKLELADISFEIDIFFKALKVAIEYDGYFYHIDKVGNDEKKNQILTENEIKLIRVRESNGTEKELPHLKGDFYTIEHDGNKLDNLTLLINKLLILIKDITGVEGEKIEIDVVKDARQIRELYKSNKFIKSLAVKNPMASEQWDYKKNGTLTPHDVYPSDLTEVFWKCHICDNSWKQKIMIRNRDSRCPYCTGARVNGKNSFAAIYPELAKYWDYEKNVEIKPSQVKPGVKEVFFFKCICCKTSWSEVLRNITRRKVICKICKNECSDMKNIDKRGKKNM
ncbi:zinc-ribbon domain-containing protein [Lysinibacillus sp. BW-2-10]|uniref:zinc-ribbon domain-containing protein n=1 Tax=Lysinibacillus sp. BW-2-10 TaxID=2590030 RepID=UPI00164340A6|nr:zinc-ribbon domain-containing protein [Lysinibacillus sp. BW-2-10]